ncbi:Proline-, glutamic acid- and leucine-rich protein 1 [Liparis tanakae]|uniref:Proline-, glutamic acid-and leucine-rich protein 1 n=1 Tax=Liparis tanakae TaxID=230148 RepID=A0A4Z2I8E1_9TELE|nr:Proline-, glutamic acid- and leucine-rich protein 1 [Liparis tanakae]
MATSAWLRETSAMRLTEGLVSVLKEQRPEYLPALLAGYREHGVFQTQSASAVGGLVGLSNAKLGSGKTRSEGLCLLSMMVKDSSSELFQQHCNSWLRSLQHVIQSQSPEETIKLAVSTLKDLLQYSSQLAQLAREVGLNSILGLLTSLLALKKECELSAMDGIMACMTFYPRACGSLRMACLCYSRLPCLGGLLDRGVGAGRAEGWTNQIHCLLASADGLLAQIYQNGAVLYEGPGVELAFPHLDQSDPLLLLQLQDRYTAVCLALKHTLGVDPASAVRLPVRIILNLVCRVLAVSSKSIPEASLGQQRAYSSVRVSVYKTLELWVQVAGACGGILQGSPGHSELLFTHLLGDITPGAESVKLRAGLSADAVPGGKPGPRRTKHLVMADTAGPSLQRKGDQLANQDSCLWALRALRQILLTSGTLLKDDMHKRLHDVVLPLCVRLKQQQSSSSILSDAAGCVSGQYSSALPRRELYRLLLALVLVPSPCWPPPLTCAVSILSNGRNDRNLKVSTFCSEALTVCNSLLHPRTPSIALPLPPLTLKPVPAASVLPSSQAAGLALPTLLGGPAPGPPFPGRHSLCMGPASLLGSLENHLSLAPGLPPAPGDMILSHQQDAAGLGLPEGQRPVFVRYDREEAEDVEISLASDSDDSVVIVPPGMLSLENQQEEAAAAAAAAAGGAQNMSSAPPGGAAAGGETAAIVPAAATATTVDRASLPNDLAVSSPLLATSTTQINSFPPPSSSVVSLDEEGMAGFGAEGEAEGGIEEIQANRAPFAEDRMKVQKVESIGVLEEAREAEADESERMDDPTMPQILCVTGGTLEEREEPEEEGGAAGEAPQDGAAPWEPAANEIEPTDAAEGGAANRVQEESAAEPPKEAGVINDKPSPARQEEQLAVQEGDAAVAAGEPETSRGRSPKETEEMAEEAEKRESVTAEPRETEGGAGGESDGEEGKGLKRKREEEQEEAGLGTEKKKVDDEVMASMLADFVACPPDDEDGASGSTRS